MSPPPAPRLIVKALRKWRSCEVGVDEMKVDMGSTFPGDRWLTTAQVAAAICAHHSEVRKLIRDGKLRAKKRVIRGTGEKPHYFVLLSEATRYMDELEDAVTVKSHRVVKPSTPRRSSAGVIQFV